MQHTALSYINEWVNKTGRAPSDVYVPEALRGPASLRFRQDVAVSGAPGYADFTGRFMLQVKAVDDRGDLMVVEDHAGNPHVVPASTVEAR